MLNRAGKIRSIPLRLFATFLSCLLLHSISGCASYQVGSRSLYPPGINTVHVQMFESDSFRRHLGERLTEHVVKELELRSPLKVVPNLGADSVLSGRIVRDDKRTLVENINDNPRDIELNLAVQFTWIDRRGNALMQPVSMPVPSLTQSVSQAGSLVPEAGQSIATAQQEAIERMARQIVTQMESRW